MDHLIGQRFNLISKSEIRYVGTLHEINPEQSTIALEDVYSFGTEDRKVDRFIPQSQQKFDYIVFRGSDVKDIKIAEETHEQRQPSPPSIPNDPAILNSSRPGPPSLGPPGQRGESPFQPPGFPPQPHFGGYYPPHQFNRGFGPPPGVFGPGPGFPPYGPPPGYFNGPNQPPFPQPPQRFQPPPPIGPPGQRTDVGQHNQSQSVSQSSIAPTNPEPPKPSHTTSELPVDVSSPQQQPQDVLKPAIPTKAVPDPVEPVAAMNTGSKPKSTAEGALGKTPSSNQKQRVTPAVPFAVNQKSFTPPIPASTSGPLSTAKDSKPASQAIQPQVNLDEAARQAKEAVANAMAKLNPASAPTKAAPPPSAAVDALAKKVGELSAGATNGTTLRGRGSYRGSRGNFRGGSRKMEIPKADYDFESANAKFNKEDLIKEAIASGSPVNEQPGEEDEEEAGTAASPTGRKNSLPAGGAAVYNKSVSFFDNLSSEAKDREDVYDGRTNPRQLRSEEFKKNVETFGQGNVDGGYRGRGRGGYRGGRGYAGNGGQRGYSRGAGTGYRGRGRGGVQKSDGPMSAAG